MTDKNSNTNSAVNLVSSNYNAIKENEFRESVRNFLFGYNIYTTYEVRNDSELSKYQNHFSKLVISDPFCKKAFTNINPDMLIFMSDCMIPVRVECVNQKSGMNSGPERLLRILGTRWLEQFEHNHGSLADYMPDDYKLPIFACLTGPVDAWMYICKAVSESQKPYFYYMNDYGEQERFEDNLKSVVNRLTKYCLDKNMLSVESVMKKVHS